MRVMHSRCRAAEVERVGCLNGSLIIALSPTLITMQRCSKVFRPMELSGNAIRDETLGSVRGSGRSVVSHAFNHECSE